MTRQRGRGVMGPAGRSGPEAQAAGAGVGSGATASGPAPRRRSEGDGINGRFARLDYFAQGGDYDVDRGLVGRRRKRDSMQAAHLDRSSAAMLQASLNFGA